VALYKLEVRVLYTALALTTYTVIGRDDRQGTTIEVAKTADTVITRPETS
jgi:hypothetical protein